MPTNGQQAQQDYFSLMLTYSQQVTATIRDEIAASSASRTEHLAAIRAELVGLDRELEAYGRARDSRDQNQRRDMISLANIQGGIQRRNLSVSRRAASSAGSVMGDITSSFARATANVSDEAMDLNDAIDSFMGNPTTDTAAKSEAEVARSLIENTTLGVQMARYETGGLDAEGNPVGNAPIDVRAAGAMGVYEQLRVANAARMRTGATGMTDDQLRSLAAATQGVAPDFVNPEYLAETSTRMSTSARQGTADMTAGTAQRWLEANTFTDYSAGLVEDHNRAVSSANRRETLIQQVDSLREEQAAVDPEAEQRELFAQRVTPSSDMMAMGTGIGGAVRRHFAGRRNAKAHQEQVDFLRNMSEEDRALMEPFTDAQALLDSFGGNHPMDGSSWDVAREMWDMRDGITDKAALVRMAAEMATGTDINERNASRDEILRNYTYLTMDGVGQDSINARSQRQDETARGQALTDMATSDDELLQQAAASSIASTGRARQRNEEKGDIAPPPIEEITEDVPPSTEDAPPEGEGYYVSPVSVARTAAAVAGRLPNLPDSPSDGQYSYRATDSSPIPPSERLRIGQNVPRIGQDAPTGGRFEGYGHPVDASLPAGSPRIEGQAARGIDNTALPYQSVDDVLRNATSQRSGQGRRNVRFFGPEGPVVRPPDPVPLPKTAPDPARRRQNAQYWGPEDFLEGDPRATPTTEAVGSVRGDAPRQPPAVRLNEIPSEGRVARGTPTPDSTTTAVSRRTPVTIDTTATVTKPDIETAIRRGASKIEVGRMLGILGDVAYAAQLGYNVSQDGLGMGFIHTGAQDLEGLGTIADFLSLTGSVSPLVGRALSNAAAPAFRMVERSRRQSEFDSQLEEAEARENQLLEDRMPL